MKTELNIKCALIFIACFISVHTVQSQGIPPHLQADMNRFRSQQALRDAQFRHERMMTLTPINRWFKYPSVANLKYDFTVILKDSTARFITSKIHMDTASRRAYLLYINKKLSKSDPNREEKLYCDQTVRIFRIDPNNYKKIEGVANDSCWLFKVIIGKITAYSHVAETSETKELNSDYLAAFQVDDEAMKPVTRENLLEVIIENTKATIEFYDGDYLAAIKQFNRDFEKSLKKQKG